MIETDVQYLLDTNTCIDVLRRREPVLSHINSISRSDCAVSTVTTYELLVGAEKSADPIGEKAKIGQFVRTITELAFDPLAARQAAQVRALLEARGLVIGPYDMLLAGHALAAKLIFVTNNVAEFNRVSGLLIENWRA